MIDLCGRKKGGRKRDLERDKMLLKTDIFSERAINVTSGHFPADSDLFSLCLDTKIRNFSSGDLEGEKQFQTNYGPESDAKE